MVFTAGVLQVHSSIHSRHTFYNLPCLLHPRNPRLPFPPQASGEPAPALASKPSLAGPPKRPPPPAPLAPTSTVQEQQQKASNSGLPPADKQHSLNGNNGQPRSNGQPVSTAGDKRNQQKSSNKGQHTVQNESNRSGKNKKGKKHQPQTKHESKKHPPAQPDQSGKSSQGSEAPQQPTAAVSQPSLSVPQQNKPPVAKPKPTQPTATSQQPKAANQQQEPAAAESAHPPTKSQQPPAATQQVKPSAVEPAQPPVQAPVQQAKSPAQAPAQQPKAAAQVPAQRPKPSLPAMAGPPARRTAKPASLLLASMQLPTLPRDHGHFASHDTFVQAQSQSLGGRATQGSDTPAQPDDMPAPVASTSQTVDMPEAPSPAQPSTSTTSSHERFADSDLSSSTPAVLSPTSSQSASTDTSLRPEQADRASASGAASSTLQQPAPSNAAPATAPAAPPSAPTPPPPAIAGPPKRPSPRPRYTERSELPGGVFNRNSSDTSWDTSANMSGPSELPSNVSPLPPPTPQAAQPAPSRRPSTPAQPSTTAAAAQQVTGEQPALVAKPGLRAPPSRNAAVPSIDAARFDMNLSRDFRDSRPQQQNGGPRPQQQNGGPRADPVAASVEGVAATVRAPAKKLRGKKRGNEDEEDGKAKGKARGRADDRGTKLNTRVDTGSRRQTRAQRKQQRNEAREAGRPEKEDILEVGLEGMSVQDLADKLAVAPTEILKELFMKGIMAQVNQVLDFETVQIVGEAFEVDILEKDEARIDDMARKTVDYLDEDDADHLQPRPPVVVVMGHVDHGKTSLLDMIRKSTVAAGEAGGITQAIGAYTVGVDMEGEKKNVTFLDTPGHEAFSAMRARGARVTDIAIIVVAADDGVRPQTLEAISHANAAEVPIVVAINKVDKEGANPERVKQELSEAGLLPEEWGGKTPMIPISAKKGTGVDELLETVALVAEVEQLMSNPDRAAAGTVLEAHLDKRVGAIATLLVQTGTLHIGDVVVAGSAYGKVRSMKDNFGDKDAAVPSTAVQMSGLHVVPIAGDDFVVAKTLDEGRKIAEVAGAAQRVGRLADQAGGGSMITTKSLASYDDDGEEEVLHRLNVILKTDASGSLEAVRNALSGLPQDSVVLRYLMATPNDITVSDIDLAAASKGLVLGFNVEPSETVLAAAKHQGVTVRSYKVIYDLLDDMRAAMEGKLSALEQRVPIGEAEVRAVFGKGSKLVAGCMVTEGLLRAECFIVVKRGRKQIWEGELTSLRRVKESVNEISQGNECGVGCKSFIDWAEGDKIEAFELVSKRRTLEDAPPPPQFIAASPSAQ